MTKHVHHDMIVEWAKDTSRVVERRGRDIGGIWLAIEFPTWNPDVLYRFNQDTKPDVVRYGNIRSAWHWDSKMSGNNLKLTFDGETGALKKAEVLK